MGANDRESHAGDPSRARRCSACQGEHECEQDAGPPSVRRGRRTRLDLGLGRRTRPRPRHIGLAHRDGAERRRFLVASGGPRAARFPPDRRFRSGRWIVALVAGGYTRSPRWHSGQRCDWSSRMRRRLSRPTRRRHRRRLRDSDPGRLRRGHLRRGRRLVSRALRLHQCRRARGRRRRTRRGRRRSGNGSRCRRARGCRRGGRRRWIRCGRRLGRDRRVGGCAARRKQVERVDVRLGDADPDAEVHVGHRVLRLAGRAGIREHRALHDRLAATDVQLAEVGQRRLVLPGRDGHRETVPRRRTRERHLAGNGCTDGGRAAERDVEPAVLPARIRVAAHGEAA
jgi:hypothetical protein